MIDGSGHFLKESRRGFPTPWVGFCRLSGLSALFPRSRFFSMYYLGHLPPDVPHPAPVSLGAPVFGSAGLFSGRLAPLMNNSSSMPRTSILVSGSGRPAIRITIFQGPPLCILKGKAPGRMSAYVRQFYRAMRQFRRKHFNSGPAAFFRLGDTAGHPVKGRDGGGGADATRPAGFPG